jgi:hypothetical protein
MRRDQYDYIYLSYTVGLSFILFDLLLYSVSHLLTGSLGIVLGSSAQLISKEMVDEKESCSGATASEEVQFRTSNSTTVQVQVVLVLAGQTCPVAGVDGDRCDESINYEITPMENNFIVDR